MSYEQTDEYGKFTDKFKTKRNAGNFPERSWSFSGNSVDRRPSLSYIGCIFFSLPKKSTPDTTWIFFHL